MANWFDARLFRRMAAASLPMRVLVTTLAVILPISIGVASFASAQISKVFSQRSIQSLRGEVVYLRRALDRGGLVGLTDTIAARSHLG
jgi:hypothetical protein